MRRHQRRIDKWLFEQLELSSFKDLHWLDKRQLLFIIAWTHGSSTVTKGNTNYLKTTSVYLAWHKFRGRSQQVASPKHLKQNFRCALHGCKEHIRYRGTSNSPSLDLDSAASLTAEASVTSEHLTTEQFYDDESPAPGDEWESSSFSEQSVTIAEDLSPPPLMLSPTHVLTPSYLDEFEQLFDVTLQDPLLSDAVA
uniref:IRF tryptophan pentad repeat domain-containing protein n=1 Tax=Macrostomum lignano TaxID=282301 RepID=A0A1I8FU79_9PLAT